MQGSKLTPQQLDYIRQHLNDHPRQAIANRLGISVQTLYRHLNQMGAVKREENAPLKEAIVREHYPHMTSREIAEQFDISQSHILRLVSMLKLKHTPATMQRIRDKQHSNFQKAHTPEARAKCSRRMHRNWQRDYERSWEGKPQLTRLHLAQTTRRAWLAKWHLRHAYGYEEHHEEPYTMVITEQTRRTKMEYLYVKRYGITFVER